MGDLGEIWCCRKSPLLEVRISYKKSNLSFKILHSNVELFLSFQLLCKLFIKMETFLFGSNVLFWFFTLVRTRRGRGQHKDQHKKEKRGEMTVYVELFGLKNQTRGNLWSLVWLAITHHTMYHWLYHGPLEKWKERCKGGPSNNTQRNKIRGRKERVGYWWGFCKLKKTD